MRDERTQSLGGRQVDLEGAQVAIVDADDLRARRQRRARPRARRAPRPGIRCPARGQRKQGASSSSERMAAMRRMASAPAAFDSQTWYGSKRKSLRSTGGAASPKRTCSAAFASVRWWRLPQKVRRAPSAPRSPPRRSPRTATAGARRVSSSISRPGRRRRHLHLGDEAGMPCPALSQSPSTSFAAVLSGSSRHAFLQDGERRLLLHRPRSSSRLAATMRRRMSGHGVSRRHCSPR